MYIFYRNCSLQAVTDCSYAMYARHMHILTFIYTLQIQIQIQIDTSTKNTKLHYNLSRLVHYT